ncbi:MAG: helical backbone metal receptor [Bacteroidales bacterium]|nr:ABC transporter substrate-binding protein [Bacteroidales bacterium]MBS3776567.1 ABC transporter substrate-binding protein [Bacteroidales bacterium]
MNKKIALIVAAIILIFSGSCNTEQPENNASKDEGLRIVSLTPSITKQLILLGVEDDVVGHTSYCPEEKLKNSELVASATEVNIEKIATLEPDLVLASTLTKEKVINNLRKLDITVKYLEMPKSFEAICRQMNTIGELAGRADKASTIVKKQREKLDSLRNTIPKGKKLKFFIEIGADPLFAATSNSFMHDYIRYANGKNIAADLKTGTISRERVIAENPDVIIIVTMGVVGKEEKETWQEYPNLKASKNNNIFTIDADQASSPTPVSFIEVLGKIIELVYH